MSGELRVFRVYNGLTGFGAVHRIVKAGNEANAIERVRASFPAWASKAKTPNALRGEEVMLDPLGVEREDFDG